MSSPTYFKDDADIKIPQHLYSFINLIVPVNLNSTLLVYYDASFEVRSIKEDTIILKGCLPQQFIPCCWFKPLKTLKQLVVFLSNREGSIFRLNLVNGQSQFKHNIRPQLLSQSELGIKTGIQYKIFDKQCNFILGKTTHLNSANTDIFVYDWANSTYSNVITLSNQFFNFKFIQHFKKDSNTLILFSNGLHYNKINFASIQMQLAQNNNPQLIQLQRKQLKLNYLFFPIGGIYSQPSIYCICNSPTKGIIVLKYNTQENSDNRVVLNIDPSLNNTSDYILIRNYLGITNTNNLLFTYKQNKCRDEKLFYFPFDSSLTSMTMNAKIEVQKMLSCDSREEKSLVMGELKDFEEVKKSLDGSCFQKYRFNKPATLNSEDYEIRKLTISSIFFFPHKYYYYELASSLQVSQNMINQFISLL